MSHPIRRALAGAVALAACAALAHSQAGDDPLRVFIRAGPKTHGPGQHDHPRFLEEWRALLGERGAQVDGALAFPTAEQLGATDVLVLYAAEGGTIEEADRANLAGYLKRGGGIVALHDSVCGDDAQWFKTVIGGAWEHGHSKWVEGPMGLYLAPEEHPITRGIPHFDLDDEIYYDLFLEPDVQVLGQSFRTVFDVEPQMWVYEKGRYRAFVSIQGHNHETFAHPAWRATLLRAIAWTGKRDADLFLTEDELAGLRYPPGGPTPPEEAATSFELHPDFEIELVASEPEVVNPISIDWDQRGRAWVATTPGYPYKEELSGIPAADQVLILDDADANGRLEVASVFYEGLDLVTSLLVHERGAIVACSPEILYLWDEDGDDEADGQTVLFSGFGFADTHAVVSNMRWGLDGWVYATQGYSGNQSRDVTGADGVDHGHIPNGLFRFRPDGSDIELVSSYGSNTWGLDFAPDGELFFTMANGAHLRHVVLEEPVLAGARVGGVDSWKTIHDHDRVHPITERMGRTVYDQIDFVGGFTAAAGCLVYDGGAWPEEFAGDHFVCEPTVNIVHRDELAPDGVTYMAGKPREQEFLASRDYWFRPVHLRTGPDGALYVLDFYNQAIVHNDTRGPQHGPTNAAVRPDRDRRHGRIWRVQAREPAERRAGAPPSAERTLLDLDDPNGWYRWNLLRLVREGAVPRDLEALLVRVVGASRPATRTAALWLVADQAPELARPALLNAMGDSDAGVRANAARLAGPHVASPEVADRLVELALEAGAPRVRLRALVSLGGAPLDARHVDALVRLGLELEDDWTRSALMRALTPHAEVALRIAARIGADGTLVELVRQVARGRDPDRVDDVLVALSRAEPAALERALRTLDAELGASFVPVRHGTGLVALERLLAAQYLGAATAALPLAARWDADGSLNEPVAELCERLLAHLSDEDAEYAESLAALPALLAVPAYRAVAIEETPTFLAPHVPLDVQLAAIEALGTVPDRRAAELLCAALPELSASASDAAFEVLLARRAGALALVEALESGDLRPQALGARRAHRLRNHPEPDVAGRATLVLVVSDASVAERMAELLPAVDAPGDALRGAEVFAEECGICHMYEGAGTAVGPDLTGMGAHGVRQLLGVILDPNAEIDPTYVEYVARTLDGQLSTGIVVRETADAIVLRSTEGDAELARADLESLRSSGLSLMPTGLEVMGPEQLRDLLTYMTAGYRGYRVLDLRPVAVTSSLRGLFDPEHDWSGWGELQRYGVIAIDGIPFEVRDPATVGGRNVLVMRGGANEAWACKTSYPRVVEIPVGDEVARVHVLGGVAGWGTPWGDDTGGEPVVRWTWRYESGAQEEVVLANGREFADWIGRHEVPGSTRVEGLVAADGVGQIRRFSLAPGRAGRVASIRLESADNHVSPVFLALTVEHEGAERLAVAAAYEPAPPATNGRVEADTFLLGGGSSHDFASWFGEVDAAVLTAALAGGHKVHYTEDPELLLSSLDPGDVLVFSTNQPLSDAVRAKIAAHVRGGGGLLALHAGTWANYPGWETSEQQLRAVASSHEPLQAFAVEVLDPEHPITRGVGPFEIVDELYRAAPVGGAGPIEVLAEGVSHSTGARYPVLWTAPVRPPMKGRIVGMTLGHDGQAHELPEFQRLLSQAVAWLTR